jgi:hypothetical protein
VIRVIVEALRPVATLSSVRDIGPAWRSAARIRRWFWRRKSSGRDMNGIPAASSLMPVSPGWHNAGPNAVRDPAADPWFCAMQQISFAMQQVRLMLTQHLE